MKLASRNGTIHAWLTAPTKTCRKAIDACSAGDLVHHDLASFLDALPNFLSVVQFNGSKIAGRSDHSRRGQAMTINPHRVASGRGYNLEREIVSGTNRLTYASLL
jgi:hypothetical protein